MGLVSVSNKGRNGCEGTRLRAPALTASVPDARSSEPEGLRRTAHQTRAQTNSPRAQEGEVLVPSRPEDPRAHPSAEKPPETEKVPGSRAREVAGL